MRIIRRPNVHWVNNLEILIPVIWYSILKLAGQKFNNLEFLWWIFIPLFIGIYLIEQFKIQR